MKLSAADRRALRAEGAPVQDPRGLCRWLYKSLKSSRASTVGGEALERLRVARARVEEIRLGRRLGKLLDGERVRHAFSAAAKAVRTISSQPTSVMPLVECNKLIGDFQAGHEWGNRIIYRAFDLMKNPTPGTSPAAGEAR